MASILGKLPDFLYERPEGVVRVRGMKLLLEGVIYLHREGIAPEDMLEAYSDLDPRIAAKIVDYYERNRETVDEYVAQVEREWEEDRLKNAARQASLGIEPLQVIRDRRKRENQRKASKSSSDSLEKVIS